MSRFYGSMQGSRGMATRCGTKSSGIAAHVRGWDIGIRSSVQECGKCGGDRVIAHLTSGSNDSGNTPNSILEMGGINYCPGCEEE